MKLDAQALTTGLGDHVAIPDYDRDALTAGIVHVGVGGFHRAHQAMYLDALMRLDGGAGPSGAGADWAVCGVGLLPGDARMRDVLAGQDHLYTLTERHPDGHEETRVIGSLVDYLFAPDDPDAVLERMAAPTTRIVSLTVTEGGYNTDPTTGEFVTDAPVVVADLEHPDAPASVFGFVVEALRRRRDRGLDPFTVMSCDNIQGNGHVARRAVVGFARLSDPGLADWIEEHVTFPSSMVDRITPATSEAMVSDVAERTGVEDGWPVVCEPFTQWVLEDAFVAGRPALERVGVQVVDDVEPYELMKLRLLNGSHQAIAYFGRLLGLEQVHDAAGDPDLQAFVRRYMHDEARPTLPEVPGVDLDEYEATLFERFTNARVADTTARLAAESSDRIPTWVVPVVRDRLAADLPVDACAAMVASWTRYAEDTDEDGEPFEIVDRLRDDLVPLARRSRDEPLAFLSRRDLFGDLAADERFTVPYLRTLEMLRSDGARATLQALRA